MREGERIAAEVSAAGLPAVAALKVQGQVLHDVGSAAVLLYPWIEGSVSSDGPASTGRARRMGCILGRIHTMCMDRGSLQPYRPRRYDESVWIAAAEEAERQQIAWAASVRGSLPDLARWGALYTETLGALERSWEVSHGDLHQENVLCSGEDSPWLIDWETAGLHQGTKDAVVSALEWSGFMEGPTDLDAFYSFLAAYRSESLLSVEDAELGLNTSFGNWLGCLHFNMQRSLGINTPDPAEQEMGLEQTFSTLRTIRRAEARFPEICEAIRRVCA